MIPDNIERLTEEFLVGRLWNFFHQGTNEHIKLFKCLPDGGIGYYNNANERRWRIEDGLLCVLSDNGEVTTRFDRMEVSGELLLLSGRHIPNPDIVLCLSELREWPRGGGLAQHFSEKIKSFGWEIGDHTYGIPLIIEETLSKLKIGRFTSIAQGVSISLGNHRTDTVTSYPFVTFSPSWPSVPRDIPDHISKGDVSIGSDVWIGINAFIGAGITIGNGAVIGAHSVVTKSVPPYAVVVGNPARIIRFRFTSKIVSDLLEISWWDWPDEVVNEYLPMIMSTEIEKFIRVAQKNFIKYSGA